MSFEIRKATEADAGAVAELHRHAPFLDEKYQADGVLPRIADHCAKGSYWLAVNDQGVAAALIMRVIDQSPNFTEIRIPLLVTREQFRRAGLARRLLRQVLEEARVLGADVLADAENIISRRLLESEGFTVLSGSKDKKLCPMRWRLH